MYDVSIIAWHVGRYSSVKGPLVVVTMIGKARHVFNPKDVRVGDLILQIGYVGADFLYRIANLRPDLLEPIEVDLKAWSKARWMLTALDKAVAVQIMESPSFLRSGSEGGLYKALKDLSRATGMGYRIWLDRVEMPPELRTLSTKYSIDPLSTSSHGLILVVISRHKPVRFLIESLKYSGYNVSVIGEVIKEGEFFIGKGEVFHPPTEIIDPLFSLIDDIS